MPSGSTRDFTLSFSTIVVVFLHHFCLKQIVSIFINANHLLSEIRSFYNMDGTKKLVVFLMSSLYLLYIHPECI